MHPYISQAIAVARVADEMRAANASRRAQEAKHAAAASKHQSHQSRLSYRTRRAFRRQPCIAGFTVSGEPCN